MHSLLRCQSFFITHCPTYWRTLRVELSEPMASQSWFPLRTGCFVQHRADSANAEADMTAGITSSLRAAQIDPAIKAISSSPKSPHEVTTPAHHSNKQRSTNAYQNVSTPSSVNARGDMAHQKSTNSSPSDAHPISHIQKWRDGNVYGADRTQQEEDPFLTSSAEHRPVISSRS